MTYYLLAEIPSYCACVGAYSTKEEADSKQLTEELCWSDEGIKYRITEEYPHEAEVTNCEYEFLCERVSK